MSSPEQEDPVAARIARILNAKREQNAEILSALKVAEDAWEGLNKEVDTAIGEEFDLIASERDAVLAAKERLELPDTGPSKDGFVFTGRVFEREKKVGLPQVLVRVLRDRDAAGEPLAEAVTDAAGAYRAVVPAQLLDPTGQQTAVRIEATTAPGEKPIVTERRTLPMAAGGVEQVDLPVPRGRGVAGHVVAGEAARDSIDETVESVERRFASMKAAHTATTRFSDLTRDGLRELSDAMSTDPPQVPGAVVVPRPEPVPPPAPAPTPSTSLEEIEGIGPRRAEKLRAAGIADVEALVRAKHELLVEILGEEGAKNALAAAEKLLRET